MVRMEVNTRTVARIYLGNENEYAAPRASARENLAPQVIQRVAKEIRQLVKAPPSGICYLPQDEEVLTDIHVEIAGPDNTPYDGGFFQVKLTLSDGFPHAPPKGVFLTKIFHPNIATNGEICVNTLKKDWTPALGIAHVLQVIRCLLIVPFPESSLNDEAGKLFMESYDEYARRAKLWTSIHAPKKSAAKNVERMMTETKSGMKKNSGVDTTQAENQHASVVSTKAPREPEASDDGDSPKKISLDATVSVTSTKVTTRVTTKITTSATSTAPLTKKRTSPTTMDALAAQKKKSTLKKGIKRL